MNCAGTRHTLASRTRRASTIFVAAGFALACAARVPAPPAPAATPRERWVQDAEYAWDVLRVRHPDLFHAEPRARFEAELAPLRAEDARFERIDVYFALMRLVALARDAHTQITDWSEIADLRWPVQFEDWTDGLWITSVTEDAQDLFGTRVLTFAGRTPTEVRDALAPLVPHENERGLARGAAALAVLPRALACVGRIDDVASVRLEVEDREGRRRTVDVASQPASGMDSWFFVAPPGWEAPLGRRSPGEAWWWTELADESTLYLQYNRCIRRPEDPFEDTAAAFLARIDRGGVSRVLIDLRRNSGGDSSVLEPLILGLQQRRLRGDAVVVAIGAGTFSSGLLNAFHLQRELDATLVGEPTAQKPDSYGEVETLVLPNTGWEISHSTKRFRLFGDDRAALAPDIPIAAHFADVLDGRDAVLDWVLRNPIRTR